MIGAPILAIAGWLGLIVTAPPGAIGKYQSDYQQLLERASDGSGEDCWSLLREAIDLKTAVDEEVWSPSEIESPDPYTRSYECVYSTSPDTHDVDHVEKARRFARKGLDELDRRGLWVLLDRIARSHRVVRVASNDKLIDELIPEVGGARNLARTLGALAFVSAEKRDDAARVRALRHTLALARVVGSGPTVLEARCAIAIIARGCDRLREHLGSHPVSISVLDEAAAELRSLTLPDLKAVLDGERLLCLDAIEWTFSDSGKGDGWIRIDALERLTASDAPFADVAPGFARPLLTLFYARKAETVEATNRWFQIATAASNAADADVLSVLQRLPASKELPTIPAILVPNVDLLLNVRRRVRTVIAGTQLVILIERFRGENGQYPGSLAELPVAEVPADPMGNARWGYRILRPESDPHGRGYLLYSFGTDGLDDQGAPATPASVNAPERALDIDAPVGSDFVINTPPERAIKPPPANE